MLWSVADALAKQTYTSGKFATVQATVNHVQPGRADVHRAGEMRSHAARATFCESESGGWSRRKQAA